MSMHKKPLTDLEREGLAAHGLSVDKPSQLADAFRHGVAWVLSKQPAQQEPVATKLETQQFNCFHVSAEDFDKLKALPVGAKLYTRPCNCKEAK